MAFGMPVELGALFGLSCGPASSGSGMTDTWTES